MIARKRLDIGWGDLAFGLRACMGSTREVINARWSAESIHCLSVRSGFDLFLTGLALPPGSEVLVSAITIPGMPRILREHGLVPVPVDLDFATLSVSADALRRGLTSKTKAILVAHLFGSRMSMEPIFEVAQEHGLIVIEDCAQAFVGLDFTGDPRSDARLFSFGPIKTATALGGGMLFVKDEVLRTTLQAIHAQWPRQSSASYLRRLLTFALFKAILTPLTFGIVVRCLRLLGRDHDAVITGSARSFRDGEFFSKIRQQPCHTLQELMLHRLRTYPVARIAERAQVGREILASIPKGLVLCEHGAAHTFWLFPIVCSAPDEWRTRLLAAGYDAARSSSSLGVVDSPVDRADAIASVAQAACDGLLYVPVYPEMSATSRCRLADLLSELAATTEGSRFGRGDS